LTPSTSSGDGSGSTNSGTEGSRIKNPVAEPVEAKLQKPKRGQKSVYFRWSLGGFIQATESREVFRMGKCDL